MGLPMKSFCCPMGSQSWWVIIDKRSNWKGKNLVTSFAWRRLHREKRIRKTVCKLGISIGWVSLFQSTVAGSNNAINDIPR